MTNETFNLSDAENEHLLSSAFDYAITPMALIDQDGKCLAVNQSFCLLTGYNKNEIVNLAIDRFTCSENHDPENRFKDELLSGIRKNYNVHKRFVHKTGAYLQIILTVAKVPALNKQSHCFLVELEKVSEKTTLLPVNSTPESEEANQFFRLSFDLFCIAGSDGYFRKINNAFIKILGCESSEILSKPFLTWVHPDDRNLVSQQFNTLISENKTIDFEIRFRSVDNNIIWVSWTFTYLPAELLIYGVGRDVTEAKRLQKIILREQNQFFEMFYGAPVTMAILKGKDHVFESANELYLKFSGRSNVVGRKVRDVFPEAETQGIFDKMDMVLETGKMYIIKEKHIQLDVEGKGILSDLYLSFMFQPFRNPEGQVEGIFYFGVDVTEQVVARKKIEENNKRYADLIENLPAAVYTVNANGYIMLYNKAAASLWGREPHLGKDKWCGSWRIYNSAGRLLPHAASPMAVTLRNRVPMQGEEMKFQKPDGAFRYIVSFPSPFFDTKGKLVGGINVLIDISERKKNEDELKQLSLVVRKTTNSVIMLNENGTIEWVNEAFTKLEGYTFNEVVGQKLDDLYHAGRMDPVTINFIKEQMNKQLPFECEIRKINKNKKSTWVESKGQPVFNGSGLLTNYFIIESDITGQKDAYKKLARSEHEIRNFARQINNVLEDERSRIAREIHDEFGQQLTGLKMSLSSLKNLPVKDIKLDEIVDDMKEGIESNIQFLRNISTELRPAILDTLGLGPSIEWLIREFEKRTAIACKVKMNLEKFFFSKNIAITFFRICQEALTNISKHSQATLVKVQLKQDHHVLSLSITDNGIGMNSAKLEDPFSMGLIGMKERARLIGAELELTSRKNVGTSIYLLAKTNE